MKEYDYNDGRIHINIYREEKKWWLSVSDVEDCSYLELNDYKTRKAAVADAKEIKAIAAHILTQKERRAAGKKYYHGGQQTFGRVSVSYAPLYPTPTGRGFGRITVNRIAHSGEKLIGCLKDAKPIDFERETDRTI